MECYVQALFTTAITAVVFMAENKTLSTVTAVLVLVAVIVANEWRGWWWRWWSRRRRRGSIQVEGGEGGHLRPPQRHNPTLSRGRGWRQEVAEWATGRCWRKSRRTIYLSQSSLAGSCPLVDQQVDLSIPCFFSVSHCKSQAAGFWCFFMVRYRLNM